MNLQWINPEKTVLVRCWLDPKNPTASMDTMEVCTRNEPGDTWGPPVTVTVEK